MSTELELVVSGGTVVLPDGPREADLGIAEGRVVAIAGDLGREAASVIDASGLHILPGAFDAHVHFNEPGRAEWEGLASGSAALAAGGATAFLDMPLNSTPPTTTAAAFAAKRAAAERSSLIDFGLWGGLVPGNVPEMDELAALGAVGFKAFMCDSGLAEFPACDEDALGDGMDRAARLGLPVAVHAEDQTTVSELTARARAAGRVGARDYLATRPIAAELAAIERAIALAGETGCALHVVHVTCGAGVALVTEARANGLDVTCETCPHYLTLTGADLERLGTVAKCAPPLRTASEQDALWIALADQTLPMVASDHSPCPPDLKAGATVFDAWGGIAGAQTMTTLMLSEAHHARGLPLERIADIIAGYPARRFGFPDKGRIEAGADADLAFVALDEPHTLAADDLRTRHRISPFIGRPLRGRVVRTLARGETVWNGTAIVATRRGRLIAPTRHRAAHPAGDIDRP